MERLTHSPSQAFFAFLCKTLLKLTIGHGTRLFISFVAMNSAFRVSLTLKGVPHTKIIHNFSSQVYRHVGAKSWYQFHVASLVRCMIGASTFFIGDMSLFYLYLTLTILVTKVCVTRCYWYPKQYYSVISCTNVANTLTYI